MSRSKRKLFMPVGGAKRGIKWYKRYFNHKNRTKLRTMLASGEYDVGYQLVRWNEWDCPRDGYTQIKDPKYERK